MKIHSVFPPTRYFQILHYIVGSAIQKTEMIEKGLNLVPVLKNV